MEEKIRRLTAFSITGLGGVDHVSLQTPRHFVCLRGPNGAGKTSVIQGLVAMLSGGKAKMEAPVNDAYGIATVTGELDDGTKLTWTQTAAGKVTCRAEFAGGGHEDKVAWFKGLCSDLQFDPLRFKFLDSKSQGNQLLKSARLDFAEADDRYKELYAQRTPVNGRAAQLKAQFEGMPSYPGAPAEAVSAGEIAADIQKIHAVNAGNARERGLLESLVKAQAEATEKRAATEAEMDTLKRKFAELRARAGEEDSILATATATQQTQATKVLELVDLDPAPVVEQMSTIDETNRQVRANRDLAVAKAQWESAEDERLAIETEMYNLSEAKKAALAAATFPVPGLSVNEDGEALYNGRPLSAASAAEELEICVGLALSQNPSLKLLLVPMAVLLDDERFERLREMARERDVLIIAERPGRGPARDSDGALVEFCDDDEAQIVLENGLIKEVE